MKRSVKSAALAAILFGSFAQTAAAETIDASVFTCKELTEAMQSKSEDDQYGASVILYWISGYLATDDQGTVVDFDNVLKEFEQTVDFCTGNPQIGVLTASQKFMGENAEEATGEALDLSVIKCEKVISSDKDDVQGLGQIMMWLAGYHASYAENTVIDFDEFGKNSKLMGDYCRANTQVGFFTASQKFMGSDEEK